MKKLRVAAWALAAFALTASSASAEIITLRCTLNWARIGQVEVQGVVLDTELRSVRYGGNLYTVEGISDREFTRQKLSRFDNERIVFGGYWPGGSNEWTIDRITGSITVDMDGSRVASGSCERAQAAF